jgi:hypothetical protein
MTKGWLPGTQEEEASLFCPCGAESEEILLIHVNCTVDIFLQPQLGIRKGINSGTAVVN